MKKTTAKVGFGKADKNPNNINQQANSLLPFAGYPRKNMHKGLPFKFFDYFELVDWTGKILGVASAALSIRICSARLND